MEPTKGERRQRLADKRQKHKSSGSSARLWWRLIIERARKAVHDRTTGPNRS